MKKFLSSLLALTMILSLVIVPANATNTCFVNKTSVQLTKGSSSSETVTVSGAPEGASFEWSSNSEAVTVTRNESNNNIATISLTDAATKDTRATISCHITKAAVAEPATPAFDETVNVSVTVTDPQAVFEATVTKVNFEGRSYDITKSGDNWSATVYYFGETAPTTGITANAGYSSYNSANKTLTVKKTSSESETITHDISITLEQKTAGTVTVTPSKDTAVQGETITLTPAYTPVAGGPVTYTWYMADGKGHTDREFTPRAGEYSWKLDKSQAIGTWTVTCTAREGSTEVKTGTCTVEVKADPYEGRASGDTSKKLVTGGTWTIKTPYIYNKDGVTDADKIITVDSRNVSWKSSNEKIAAVSSKGVVTAGEKSGDATITATITYNTKPYEVKYKVEVKALDVDLKSITNGEDVSYSDSEFARILANKISDVTDASFTARDVDSVKLLSFDSYLKFTEDKKNGSTTKDLYQDFRIHAVEGYLGEQTFKVSVNDKYTVTLTIKIEGDKDIKDTVTGSASGKDVTFTNSDYDYLFVYKGSASFKSSMYDGDWSKTSGHSDWTPVKKNSDYTVKSSAFDKNGKATLYVVVVDNDIASTGTITVSQKSYDITYSVVAGKSVTFSQKDFEAFMKDYAQDNGDWTTSSRKDYPYVDFDHVELNSIPNSKNEGTLYYKNSEVTSSSNRKAEYTDMDKMTFEAVAKPSKDTVTLRFTVVGKQYSSERDKGSKVSYPVDVVISVVKEDIVYTVGIDDTVNLKASDFVSFLQDAKSSYRKAELDYVQFDVKNASNYLYGGLYRSYTNYSSGKLAENSDKFYYEPSRNQLDLSDVAYHTTRWAEAGKTVYIPFTVYGTKNEEATGTMAITIAQTMNFTDVKSSDFFYEPVRWAVNQGITNGTSATTFSPYKACTRAEIVTFLWRAAGSPEPTRSTNPFTDVNAVTHSAYYKAILWASQKGITSGTSATTFAPNQLCTRSQIVTFLYRYAGKPSSNYTNPFKDVSATNEASYYNAILWAVGKGITTGTSATTFAPYASCTRGEAVTFLYRYVNGVK